MRISMLLNMSACVTFLSPGGKIIAVEPHLENVNIPGMETVDAAGRRVTPGLIDQHIHVTGGGGEGGWASRCPELNFSSLVKGGVTSFMGVSGTDSMSRSIENLLAKVRGLTVEGASGWMWTSNYAYPPATITGSVKGDLFAIPNAWASRLLWATIARLSRPIRKCCGSFQKSA